MPWRVRLVCFWVPGLLLFGALSLAERQPKLPSSPFQPFQSELPGLEMVLVEVPGEHRTFPASGGASRGCRGGFKQSDFEHPKRTKSGGSWAVVLCRAQKTKWGCAGSPSEKLFGIHASPLPGVTFDPGVTHPALGFSSCEYKVVHLELPTFLQKKKCGYDCVFLRSFVNGNHPRNTTGKLECPLCAMSANGWVLFGFQIKPQTYLLEVHWPFSSWGRAGSGLSVKG